MLLLATPVVSFGQVVPRKIVAFWDSLADGVVEDSLIHRTLEMPLNYLGFELEYYDVQHALPNLTPRQDVGGVLICFKEDTRVRDPEVFINWVVKAIDEGKKIGLCGYSGFSINSKGVFTSIDLQNQIFERLGWIKTENWVNYPYDYTILCEDPTLTSFEKPYPNPLPGFYQVKVSADDAYSYLSAGKTGQSETTSDLIIISPRGGYISELFANNYDANLSEVAPRTLGWYIDPFLWCQKVFLTESFPIPDVTTLVGSRIFFATCHGDNWNTVTQIEEYDKQEVYCAEIVLERIIKPYPDLPVTVAIVAADLDPNWVGKEQSRRIARACFEQPQVEPASHTYSHPFYWNFFKTGGPEKELNYLYLYPYGSWQNSYLSWFRANYYQKHSYKSYDKSDLVWGYTIPRAYANYPFDLQQEIKGAVDFNQCFVPEGRCVDLLVWSGDSRPWSTPVLLSQKIGVKNFGGGFARFDADYPSYLFVYPLARTPAGVIQPYAASNAENSYTNEWHDSFYGFQYLPATLMNTDTPKRVKPIHLYYHSYSGEFQASVDAVLKNLAFIKTCSPIAVTTHRYCEVVEGFFSVELEKLEQKVWAIRNRKGLQTLRWDHAQGLAVDFSRSVGVIGYYGYQGSIYIHLDAAVDQPILAIKSQPLATVPYLVTSSWEVWQVQQDKQKLSFMTKGWGACSMKWKMPEAGSWKVKIEGQEESTILADKDDQLYLNLNLPFNQEIKVSISKS
ncbi:MAG: hypothetical protein JSR97_09235 [Verrucomicrobia bacterium]|nr:hypothetical protein [Verrucomicrobiota bacterium]